MNPLAVFSYPPTVRQALIQSAVLHEFREPLAIEEVARPQIAPDEVCGDRVLTTSRKYFSETANLQSSGIRRSCGRFSP
jgi:hypothetical protein